MYCAWTSSSSSPSCIKLWFWSIMHCHLTSTSHPTRPHPVSSESVWLVLQVSPWPLEVGWLVESSWCMLPRSHEWSHWSCYSLRLWCGSCHEKLKTIGFQQCLSPKQCPQDLNWLVVWNIFYFFHILGIMIPTDELIFFRGVGQPPTG